MCVCVCVCVLYVCVCVCVCPNGRCRRLDEFDSDAHFPFDFGFSAFGSHFSLGLERSPSVFVTDTATIIGISGPQLVCVKG